jgi:Flp pilus assembly pilin Flp
MKDLVMKWRWLKDERGANTVEMVMIVGALTLLTAGVVDVGRLMTEYNAIQKGVEMGVREAVTRDPIVQPLKFHFLCNQQSSNLVGELCIDGDGNQRPECDFGSWVCTDTGCTGVVGGITHALDYSENCDSGDPGAETGPCLSQETFDGIVDEMQSSVPSLSPANVTVSYKSTKLGFVGMVGALPGDVTVDITGVPFGFMASLPFGEIAWTIPRMSHTFTGEDMSNNTCADQRFRSTTINGVPGCSRSGKADEALVLCLGAGDGGGG